MVKFINISQKFGNRVLFEPASFSLPEKGLVALVGDSGSGKTTLLNIISGLNSSYDGSIKINEQNLKEFSLKELSAFRLSNIGYVFQNFNLFNLDSVFENVYLPISAVSSTTPRIKKRRVNEVLKSVGIYNLRKKAVNKLSGGEKQRVAIARAIINQPKIVICDEPTGALDEANSKLIFDLLKTISNNTLVIVATHDVSSIIELADIILKLKDKKVTLEHTINNYQSNKSIILPTGKKVKNPVLPLGFKLRHAFQKYKTKKWRSLVTNLMLSLSLTGIGLSIIITDSISNKINQAFSEILNGNEIVVKRKNQNQNVFTTSYNASYENIGDICNKYEDDIEGIGANYIVNFENFFKDKNEFVFYGKHSSYIMKSLSARNVNDFTWIENKLSNVFYPYEPSELSNDQIVIGLSYVDMVNLCFTLQIERNYTSLGHYIKENGLTVVLQIENKDWQYEDEQIFDVVAITESSESKLFHKNKLWNEFVFEESMRIPSDDNSEHYLPWEMEKIYYIKTNQDSSILLNKLMYDSKYDDFIFENTSNFYNPTLCDLNVPCNENRIFIYYVDKNSVNPSLVKKIQEYNPLFKNYYFLSSFGYSSFATSIFSGFSKNFFVSLDENLIDMAIDADTTIESNNEISLKLPDGIVQGNYLNTLDGGLKFSTQLNNLIAGREPKNNNEIVISLGLAKTLSDEVNLLGNYLNLSTVISEENRNGNISKNYGKSKALIVGITNESKNYIYHNCDWSISFFRDNFGISSFLLVPTGIVFEFDKNIDVKALCNDLNFNFREFEFTSPISVLNENLNSTLSYANTILISFSILSAIISILLLATVTLLSVIEAKEEINLFYYLGFQKKDINSTFVYQSLVQGFVAFIFSAIEIVVCDQFLTYFLGDYLGVGFAFSINIKPIIVTLFVSIILPIFVAKTMTILLSRNIKLSKK